MTRCPYRAAAYGPPAPAASLIAPGPPRRLRRGGLGTCVRVPDVPPRTLRLPPRRPARSPHPHTGEVNVPH